MPKPIRGKRAKSDDPDMEFDEGPSKSARKREMTALQELGEALCALSPRELGKIPIDDEDLLAAIEESSRIKQNSAMRRHRQYIGKLMRRIDPEPLQQALDALYQSRTNDTQRFQQLEELRDKLIRDGDAALGKVINQHPGADRQQLRQLIREAQREAAAEKPPAASRRLFRYLRELQAEA
ncbi:ribosome biogenesis factor YjgA [Congregibacter variabilis]|uniref:Dual-action ribosomal maturation protein DarP n=1 Tax=Congregibacter variabilis TaxID=3081200 RepID=A0ABZ0I845_9GAMM|nr:ribosome biogenesis factor YjgA [Congregibacter sp. IMCC43200]